MNCLQNILADFQKLVLKSEEKPSSYETASIYKDKWERMSNFEPKTEEEFACKEECLVKMKQFGTMLGVSEEGVTTFPHIEECCEEIYEIESFGEDVDTCLADLNKILCEIDEIENKELESVLGIVPHYMVVKLNCMREHVNRLIIEFNNKKNNS